MRLHFDFHIKLLFSIYRLKVFAGEQLFDRFLLFSLLLEDFRVEFEKLEAVLSSIFYYLLGIGVV